MELSEKKQAVRRMREYIKNHLNDVITLSALARAAGYSPWHAAKVFKELTGKAPFEYIRALRLSHAALKLRNNNTKVIDVAFDFVFDSHEGFTRAFSRQFGMNPKSYRENHTKQTLKLFIPDEFREIYLTSCRGVDCMSEEPRLNTVFVQVVERSARKVILKHGTKAKDYFAYCDEVGCDVWEMLTAIPEATHEPIGMWLPENLRAQNTSEYVQGVEVPLDYSGKVPDGFDVIELPPCKMMIFQGPPFEDEEFGEAIGNLWEVMKAYDPELYGFWWADQDGPRFQLEPRGYRGYIEGRPVRVLNQRI